MHHIAAQLHKLLHTYLRHNQREFAQKNRSNPFGCWGGVLSDSQLSMFDFADNIIHIMYYKIDSYIQKTGFAGTQKRQIMLDF